MGSCASYSKHHFVDAGLANKLALRRMSSGEKVPADLQHAVAESTQASKSLSPMSKARVSPFTAGSYIDADEKRAQDAALAEHRVASMEQLEAWAKKRDADTLAEAAEIAAGGSPGAGTASRAAALEAQRKADALAEAAAMARVAREAREAEFRSQVVKRAVLSHHRTGPSLACLPASPLLPLTALHDDTPAISPGAAGRGGSTCGENGDAARGSDRAEGGGEQDGRGACHHPLSDIITNIVPRSS